MKYIITAMPISFYDAKLSLYFLGAVFIANLGEFIYEEIRR